jgi:hypothetical protein
LSGKKRRNNLFVGAFLIFYQYKQTALKQDMLNNWQYSDSYTKVTASRVTGFPATTIGFTHQISYHITLEWGIQKSFFIRKDNYIGIKRQNYQPGAGSLQSDPFIGDQQGIASIRYRLGGSK